MSGGWVSIRHPTLPLVCHSATVVREMPSPALTPCHIPQVRELALPLMGYSIQERGPYIFTVELTLVIGDDCG